MNIFGNYISKCNRLSENIIYVKAIEVFYRLRNKQNIISFPLKHPVQGVSKITVYLLFFLNSNTNNNNPILFSGGGKVIYPPPLVEHSPFFAPKKNVWPEPFLTKIQF